MTKTTFQLPTRKDGFDGLETLIQTVGIQNFQQFMRWARDKHDTTITDFISVKAATEVLDLKANNPDMTYVQARLQIARRWGYSGTSLTNFYRYADAGLEALTGKTPKEMT